MQASLRKYDVPIAIPSMPLIRWLAAKAEEYEPESWKALHLARCLARIVGLDEIGLLDIDITVLGSVLDQPDMNGMREYLIEAFCMQIDRRGTTISADVNAIDEKTSPELAKRVPRILEIREREMEAISAKIGISGDTVDLGPLWLTAYGYEILSALELGLECTMKEFAPVSDAFAKIGFELRIIETGEPVYPPTEMSEEMREYIWFMVEYRRNRNDT